MKLKGKKLAFLHIFHKKKKNITVNDTVVEETPHEIKLDEEGTIELADTVKKGHKPANRMYMIVEDVEDVNKD